MTQDERWIAKYNEVKAFIESNQRNPSKHRIEEHDMLNWLKANRKHLNAGSLKPERVVQFKELLALTEVYLRKNKYTTISSDSEYLMPVGSSVSTAGYMNPVIFTIAGFEN